MNWEEPDIAFRVTFTKKNFVTNAQGEIITDTSEKPSEKLLGNIIKIIKYNDRITIPKIAKEIGLSEYVVEQHIQTLRKAGKLKRKNSIIDLTERQKEILEILTNDIHISVITLSNLLRINSSAVQTQLNILKQKGAIKRIGGARGYWQVN